ncbi:glycosyltransferase family 4 protein [Brevibacterium luteolum]|uniref:glycosyltransferase family 4 protein n=1 Tax=Brevibacterium luteolum TaxID=199591 RepID=UPI0038797D13
MNRRHRRSIPEEAGTSPVASEPPDAVLSLMTGPEQERINRRSTLASEQFTPSALTDYGRFLIENSQGTVAEEILALSLASNGAQADALELYQELCRELDLPDARWKWALSQLEKNIAAAEREHRGALDFAIPYRLETVFDAVEKGTDPVSKAIAAVAREYERGSTTLTDATAGLGHNDQMRVRLTVLLGRRSYQCALEQLDAADPVAIPNNALRRALRRARAEGDIEAAIAYARMYQSIHPGDSWSATLIEKLQVETISNNRIAITGFPFKEPNLTPSYDPRNDHILYAIHNSLPFHATGYATRSHGILSALKQLGWNVEAVTRLGYPYDLPGNALMKEVPVSDRIDGVVYRRLLNGREIEKKNPVVPYIQRYAAAIEQLAIEQRPAIIHAASNHLNGLAAVSAARELGIPSIYEIRGLWEITRASRDPEFANGKIFKFISRMEADAAKAATRVLTLTNALKDEMVSRGVDPSKIRVVPNGVDTTRFVPQPADSDLAKQLGLDGKMIIGYVGSVLDYEGLDLLVESVEDMSNYRDDFHVLIVGDGADLERLREKVSAMNLDSTITFTGRVEHGQVEAFYSLIDIAPFPRKPLDVCELVSPLKPFEAMAMGKAVVVSDVAAMREFIVHDVNGISHEKGSAISLTSALNRLLDDPDEVARLGKRAREWVVQNRDWRSIARNIDEVYGELV